MTTTLLVNLADQPRLARMFLPADFERLARLGTLVRFDPATGDAGAFRRELARADTMLTCWGSRPLTPADWPAERDFPFLLAHAAGSVRGFVPREMLGPGLRVTQSAQAMAPAVAQWAVGLMLWALRQALARTEARKAGRRTDENVPYADLEGLTVGLVGLSQVGRRVPPLLAPFGVSEILAYDPYWSPQQAAQIGVTLMGLDELIARADVVSLHAPVTDETRQMLDARRVGLLKSGAVVVNTARAALTDQDALFARAITGDIQVYVDVTHPEPLPPNHLAYQSPNIYVAPHIGGASTQALRRMATFAIDEIERFLQGLPLQGEVTPGRYDLLA